jgi:hypothetical protein
MKGGRFILTAVLVLLQFCCSSLWSRPTTPHQAEKVVTGWLKADGQPLGTWLGQKVMKVETFTNNDGEPVYYIVYLQPSGFVIVPADDFVEPIIGFVDDGIYDPSLDNPLGALVTNDLNGRIAAVRDMQRLKATALMEAAFESQGKWEQLESLADGPVAMGLTSISDVRVAPLVQSKWWQGTVTREDCPLACYNYYTPPFTTPDGDPNNYVCGCVATALAQVIRYHRHPTTGIGVHTFGIHVGGSSTSANTRGGDGSGGPYSWSDMVLVPDCSTTETQRQAIGALCYDAGVTINMYYTSSWSAANTLKHKDALTNIFKYGNAVKGGSNSASNNIGPGLIGMINPNLDAKDPVTLEIGPSNGHSIVCDGYGYNSSTLYHHLNMGWLGTDDAWYNLPDIDTSHIPVPYTSVYKCVYNIHVSGAGDGEIISGRVLDLNGEPIAGATMYAQPEGQVLWITTESDSKGIYAFSTLNSNTAYTINALADGYRFSSQFATTRTSADYSSVSGNVWGIDFYGQAGPRQPLFVDDDAPPGGDGSNWANAYNRLQEALAAAWIVDEIRVAQGIYKPYIPAPPPPMGTSNEQAATAGIGRAATFQLKYRVTVKGGYAGFGEPDPHARDIQLYETILSGDIGMPGDISDNSYHVVTGSGTDATAVLDGFTITGGNADGSYTELYDRGGGMYNDSGSPTITNCTFSSNAADNFGGGVYSNGGSPTMTNCMFRGNHAIEGGGMHTRNSNPALTNCTFTVNRADANGGGIYNKENSSLTLTNCILWGDEPNEIVDSALSSTTVTYSDVQDGWPGEGNIDADPCFADADDGDYHLKSQAGRWNPDSHTWVRDAVTSPCIDAGDWDSDWSGELWPHGERINMGAYGGTPEASMSLSDAGNIADLNIDGLLCYRDMKLFTGKWLYEAFLLPEDLSRDGTVNFTDFAIFANIWRIPNPSSNPNPLDGTSISNLEADLSWTAGRGAISHDVYFGTSNPLPFIRNQTATIFDPGTMATGIKYYWRIDEVNHFGTTTGTVWSFTTMQPPPP